VKKFARKRWHRDAPARPFKKTYRGNGGKGAGTAITEGLLNRKKTRERNLDEASECSSAAGSCLLADKTGMKSRFLKGLQWKSWLSKTKTSSENWRESEIEKRRKRCGYRP